MADALKPKVKKTAKKGKTVEVKKVKTLEDWLKYYKRGYQNVVVGEDGSYLVLDPEVTKTDFAAALAEPKHTIRHLMGEDYITVLADPKSSAELRAAAEARRTQIVDELDARVSAAKLAYSEAETELMTTTQQWKHAPDAPTRMILAQSVARANAAVAAAERELREAQAPRRYIIDYSGIPRMLLNPGSGDDRPILNVIYRAVPEVTDGTDRVVVVGGASPAANSVASNANA
jgi:hypothetical protein